MSTRDASRGWNTGVFVHYRTFRHGWQAAFFAPAGSEALSAHPSWADLQQVLVVEGDQARRVFPHDAFTRPPGAYALQ